MVLKGLLAVGVLWGLIAFVVLAPQLFLLVMLGLLVLWLSIMTFYEMSEL